MSHDIVRTTSAPDGRSRSGRRRVERRSIAATAVGLLFLMQFGLIFGVGQFKLLALILGIGLLVAAKQWPFVMLRFAVVWIPLSPVLLSVIYKLGLPSQLVSSGTYIRSGVVWALALSGWSRMRSSGRALDVIDRLGLAYLAVVATYFLAAPALEATPLDFTTRLRGVQSVSTFVIVFFAIRWLDLTEAQRESVRRWATGVIGVIAIAGLYQRLDQSGFNRLLFEHIDIDIYLRGVAKLSGRSYSELRNYYFQVPPRVGSLSLAPFAFADVMLCGVALGLAGTARRAGPLNIGLIGVCSIGVFISDSRIAILALAAAAIVALVGSGMSELAKVRLVLLAVVAALALMPLLLQSRLVQADDNATSDEGHSNELIGAIESIIDKPLGSGVGTEGGITRRFANESSRVSGNATLSLGIQIGAVGMATFLALLATVIVRARRAPPIGMGHHALLAKVLLAGTIVSSMTHNAWQEPGAGPTTWILLGLAISGAADRRGPDATTNHDLPRGATA